MGLAQWDWPCLWSPGDTGSIPGPAERVKDPLLLQLGLRLDHWPRKSIYRGEAKKKGRGVFPNLGRSALPGCPDFGWETPGLMCSKTLNLQMPLNLWATHPY